MPNSSPVSTSDSANGSAHRQDHRRPRTRGARPTATRRRVVGQLAEQLRRPDEVGVLGRGSAIAERVEHEDRDQHAGVEQREVVLERERQRVQRRDREERDLDRSASGRGATSVSTGPVVALLGG